MLYFSLVLSAVLLLIIIAAVYRSENPLVAALVGAVVCAIGPLMLGSFSVAATFHAALLVVAVVAWRALRWRRRSFLPLACAATLVAYGLTGWFAVQAISDLRAQFPYVSMEERLPPKGSHRASPLPASTAARLDGLEERIEDRDSLDGLGRYRLARLEQLHEDTVRTFVNQPGFGVSRMTNLSALLKIGLRTGPPLPQPGVRSASSWSAGTPEAAPPARGEADRERDLLQMHQLGVADFVHPSGFGFFKDRAHVAGFQEHQFSEVPVPAERWKVRTLDLIGLAMHDEPVAYVSAHLPRMDELRDAPTRPPDGFESSGLAALHGGEDLFVRETEDGLRVLGAIRSARQCLSCHEGERGDLLGAFSYTLARERR